MFVDLHQSRSYGMGGPSGLSYTELDAYARVHDRRWSSVELEAIRAVDRVFLATAAERDEASAPSGGGSSGSGGTLAPSDFGVGPNAAPNAAQTGKPR